MDAVQAANSGHPGLPMAMAPAAYLLFARSWTTTRRTRSWPDRDRFVLSAGHGSMLLYAALHLSGYDLPLDELKRFRQWGSLTPGPPRARPRPRDARRRGHHRAARAGLRQRRRHGDGRALPARALRRRGHGPPHVRDLLRRRPHGGHRLRGRVAGRPARARQARLPLRRQLDLARRPDVAELRLRGRHASASRPTAGTSRGRRRQRPRRARGGDRRRHDGDERPTLIRVQVDHRLARRPTSRARRKAHGAALGEDEVRATKEAHGLGPRRALPRPRRRLRALRPARARREAQARVERALRRLARAARGAGRRSGTRPGAGAAAARPGGRAADVDWGKDKIATRSPARRRWRRSAPFVPTMVGGAADLSESTQDRVPGRRRRALHARQGRAATSSSACASTAWAARSTAWPPTAASCGPYGSTFLQFADYMRGSIRLVALTGLPVAWVYTHDSVALGEDGPTHQPVEHLAALRAIPGLVVLRPADANETAEAWRVILEDLEGPACSRSRARTCRSSTDRRRRRRPRRLRARATPTTPSVVARRHRRRGPHRARARPTLLAADGRRRARGLDAVAGSSSPRRTTPTATRCCRPALPTRLGRGGHLDGLGALGRPQRRDRPLRRLARPGPRCSRSSASRPSTSRRSPASCSPWSRRPRARSLLKKATARLRPPRGASRHPSAGRCHQHRLRWRATPGIHGFDHIRTAATSPTDS